MREKRETIIRLIKLFGLGEMHISMVADEILALFPANETGLVKKLDEYIAFLDKANQGPVSLAFVHGWRCPQEDIEIGERLRKEIDQLRGGSQNETGLVRVRECYYHWSNSPLLKDCPICHGTGTIREKVSESEAMEILKKVISDPMLYVTESGRWKPLVGDRIELAKEGE